MKSRRNISKTDIKYMGTDKYKREHDAQAYKMIVNDLLDRGFNLKQIRALEKEAEEIFGKPTNLRS
jgi:SOS response regulatory protein OraA/RecX